MFKKAPKRQPHSTESDSTTSTDDQRVSALYRRTPTLRTNITPKSGIVSKRKSRRCHLTKEDLDFIELYTKHFPGAVHRVRPPNRFKRRRKNQSNASDSEQEDQNEARERRVVSTPESGHTYELAKALGKMKRRPMASGIQGQIRLIGALRKLDQDRECSWKCWMQCAMRREAEHINNMRLSIMNTRAKNLQDVGPDWYQQLSWDQMKTVNNLEMTLYQDIDESTTKRTQCLLRTLGIEPPPSHRIIKYVMTYSKDDPCKFLLELYRAVSPHGRLPGEKTPYEGDDDELSEEGSKRKYRTGFEYSLDERLILSALAHLRIGNILNCLNKEFGKPNTHLPYFRMVLPPCQKRRRSVASDSTWPYLQPVHIPEYNWLEPKLIQDAIYAQNLYMTQHRVPPPVPPELRPVPYTHIEIPEYLKPRRHKKAKRLEKQGQRPSSTGSHGTETVISTNTNTSYSTYETSTARHRSSKSTTSGTDIASMGTKSRRSDQSRRRRRRRRRPSVVRKPRRRFLATCLKKFRESSKLCVEEASRPTTPLVNHPLITTPQKAHRHTKEECPCDCKDQKKNQVAEKGDRRLSPSADPDESNKGLVRPAKVAGYLAEIPDEPLVKLSNTQELPAIQKWIRMKNGLIYTHPLIAAKLIRRSKNQWNILDGGRCSMIQAPELCLTKREERSLTWDHIFWLRRESDRIVEEYYRTCFEMQVALSREFYPSMATDFFRSRDKFLKIYFTYLPSRPQDCFRRPWRKSDYNREIYNRWKKRFQEMEAARKKERGY